MSSILIESLPKVHKHLWGQDVTKVVRVNYLTFNLALFRRFPQNTSRQNILFIREEYQLAYEAILEKTRIKEKWGSAFLVTGQPGNGVSVNYFEVS